MKEGSGSFFEKKEPKKLLDSRAGMRWRRLIWPGVAAFLCFWLLIGLGVWQLHRLKWKEGILADIHRAELAPPVPLPARPGRFQKVAVQGVWLPNKAALYGDEVHDGPVTPVEGGQLIQPLRTSSGQTILVDLGWVPERAPQVAETGPASVVGYVRASVDPGWFAGKDKPGAGLYYTLTAGRIGAGMGLPHVAPFVLVAMGALPPPGSPAPQPQAHLPRPPNNHYEYALTWFGLAIVLVFEFIFFARKRLREA